MHKRCLAVDFARPSGVLINASAWTEGTDHNLILHAAAAFQVNVLLVVGHEKMYSQLKADAKLAEMQLQIAHLPKSGGVVNRSPAYRREQHTTSIRKVHLATFCFFSFNACCFVSCCGSIFTGQTATRCRIRRLSSSRTSTSSESAEARKLQAAPCPLAASAWWTRTICFASNVPRICCTKFSLSPTETYVTIAPAAFILVACILVRNRRKQRYSSPTWPALFGFKRSTCKSNS